MADDASETLTIGGSDDVVRARQAVRAHAVAGGFSLVDQTKLVTAASEIARNMIDYGGGGTLSIETLQKGARRGLRLSFVDRGPGIVNLDLAMTDGYSTGGGLGLGLSGAKRLSSEFSVKTAPGAGTTVMLARWR